MTVKLRRKHTVRTPNGTGRAQSVPLLHQLSAGHRGDRDVDQPDVAALVLLPLPVSVFVEVEGDGVDGGKTAEVETLPPEDVVRFKFTGRPGVEAVIQTQLTEVPAVERKRKQQKHPL